MPAAPAVDSFSVHTQHNAIDFSKRRRGIHSLAHDVERSKSGSEVGTTGGENLGRKTDEKKSKKVGNLESNEKFRKEAAAFSKIKDKEQMAAKMRETDSLFQDPINDAAQARLEAIKRKDEQRQLEIDIKKKYKQAMAEEIELTKKEAAEREQAEKEIEMALKKSKTHAEREAVQKIREMEDKNRKEQQQQKAEELLLAKRKQQAEREAVAIEKEAEADYRRQQDAENLKKTLEASRLAATSLKPARKKHGRTVETGTEKAINVIVDVIEIPDDEDDGGLFIPESIGEPSDKAKLTDKSLTTTSQDNREHWPLTPMSPLKRCPNSQIRTEPADLESKASEPAALAKEFPKAESLSLRARAGWKGARRADFETKAVGIVIQQYIEKFQADQNVRDEASARERARANIQSKKEKAALVEGFRSVVAKEVQEAVKVAIERAFKERPSAVIAKERSQQSSLRDIAVSQQKYASETQWLLNRPVARQLKDLAPAIEKIQEQNEARREKEIRLAENARKRFEVKLHKDNAEQSRPMSAYEFSSLIEKHMKDWREKRGKALKKKKRMMPHPRGSLQLQDRFGYEDVDSIECSSTSPNKSNESRVKGQSGGIMARMRESNDFLNPFQAAAATKIVDDGINRLEIDADSESEVSEEDPDDDDGGQPGPTQASYSQKYASETLERITPGKAKNSQGFSSESDISQLSKPRHLQDKEMVYIFSVQRSEIRNQERSQPVIMKQFFDRNDANAFAEEELKQTRWGPSMHRPRITQSYSKDSGLFQGEATIDSEEDVLECVDVVALAQYIGDLDNSEHRKVNTIFKPKLYFILKSTTKTVQIPNDNDEAKESEEVEQNNGEKPDNGESKHNGEINVESIGALFGEDEDDEESENSNLDPVTNIRQSPLASEAPRHTITKNILKQTCKTLDAYTDRELANKRASEIFLAEVKPVGGDVAQLAEYENDVVKQIREHLDSYNSSGELFSATNQLSNDGEEFTVWVEDFQLGGPLN